MLPILLAGCLWVATQDDTRSFRELAEDQLQIQRALDRLEGTIEGLAKKLESQGRSHAVELLNAALAKLRARDEAERRGSIEERVAQIREELIGKRAIPAAEKQEALLRDLEDLLAILLDRKPIEKLDERLAAAREAAEEISKLRDEERQLAEETRQLAEGARSRDEEAMSKRIDDLLQRQRELDAKSREAERLSGALEAEQRVRDLEELLAMQKAAAAAIDRLGKGSSPVADKAAAAARAADAAEKAAAKAAAAKADAAAIQGLLEKAAELRRQREAGTLPAEAEKSGRDDLASEARARADAARASGAAERAEALDEIAKKLAEGGDPASASKASSRLEEEARAAAEAAREAAEALAKAFDQANAVARESTQSFEDRMDAASGAADAARRALQSGDMSSARKSARAAAEAARQAEETARAAESAAALSRQEERLAGDAAALARDARVGSRATEGSRAAAAALDEAKAALEQAARELKEEKSDEARSDAQRAVDAIERARELAKQDAQARGAAGGPEKDALAKAQEDLAKQAEQLSREIASKGGEGAEAGLTKEQAGKAGEAVGRSSESMKSAAESGRSGQSGEAARSRQEAEKKLEEAKDALARNRQRAERNAKETEALAKRQEEIKKDILDLARRLKDRPNSPRPPQLDDAARSAGEAQDELDRGIPESAVPEEEKTEKYLEEARQDVEQERRRYQRLKQEELLFKIGEELASLEKEHAEARATVDDVESKRGRADLSRAEAFRLKGAAKIERGVGEQSGKIGDALEQEETKVFASMMRANQEDLDRVAKLLDEDYRTDDLVRSIQEDVSRRLTRLKDALRDETRRRRNPEQNQQPEQNGQQGKPTLVPILAELKMLKLLEEDLSERTVQLLARTREDEGFDPLARSELNRLANRHAKLTELFQHFKTRIGLDHQHGPEGSGGEPPPDEPPVKKEDR